MKGRPNTDDEPSGKVCCTTVLEHNERLEADRARIVEIINFCYGLSITEVKEALTQWKFRKES